MVKPTIETGAMTDYQLQYDGYWESDSRIGESSGDMDRIAEQVVMTCGVGRTLDIGSGEGLLVASLLRRGVEAHGVDVSEVVTARCNKRLPSRFTHGSVLALPFEDASFQTVVSTDCMEHLAPEDVPKALKEIHRVAGRYVFLQLATTLDRDGHWHLTVEGRAWWEARCFEAGFRKHPAYYKINSYESLNDDSWQITIILEKIPERANKKYPLSALAAERDLHMDMLREVGERSDAHVARYLWAEKFVRQGDRVLDAACGLGYGSYALAELSKARKITGVDGSEYAVDYACENFCSITPKLDFLAGYLPGCLEKYPDGYFDVIVSFETLEHVEQPEALLKEFHRLLSPGGRIVVSVPNDWSDETGEDPNPFHLHVYTLDKLREQISRHFIPEALVQQIASGCKTTSAWNSWQRMPRTLRNIAIDTDSPPPSEWWLMVGMKDPVTHSFPYRESVYGYSAPPDNLLRFESDYKNPWLVRSLLEFQFRATHNGVLRQIAQRVLEQENEEISADRGAALAVLGYQLLANDQAASVDVERFIEEIAPYVSAPLHTPHLQRFHVSLGYLTARLFVKIGRFNAALPVLKRVANADLSIFSPTLGSKVVDAAFEAGLLEAGQGCIGEARASWKLGVERAYAFLSSDVREFVGNIDHPHEFPTIVAVELLDSAVRCIKALRVTAEDSYVPITRLYELTRENWKGMLEERYEALHSMEAMIRDRDAVIANQAHMLEERWSSMQSMEAMIRDRDEAITSQAHMLEERWSSMQSMEAMIRDRDEAITSQAHMLQERWSSMQSMEAIMQARGEALTLLAPNTQAVLSAAHEGAVPFTDLACSLYLFSKNLLRAARANGARDLLFFAREGQLLKEMFDLQQALSGDRSIRTHYLRVSRRSTFLMSLGELQDETFEVLFRQYRRISILDFLKSLDLDEQAVVFAEAMGVSPESFARVCEDLPTDPDFISLRHLAIFQTVYETQRVQRAAAFERYLIDLLGEHCLPNVLHVVDVGWKGSIQDNLSNWFRRVQGADACIEGYYLGLVASGAMSDTNRKVGLLFSNIEGQTPGFHVFNENRSLFEVVLHADHGSARSYVTELDGSARVIEDAFTEGEIIAKLIAPVTAAVMTRYRAFAAVVASASLSDSELFDLALERHARMVFRPSDSEIDWMLAVSHVENFGVFETSTFKREGTASFAKRMVFSLRLLMRRPVELGFWPWLTIRSLALPGLAKLYGIVRSRQSH